MALNFDTRYRPVWAEIYVDRLRHNLKEVRRLVGPKVAIFAVVKADAYGHGAIQAAKAFVEAGANYLAVALPEEGIELRQAGFTQPILVFGPYFPNQAQAFLDYDLMPTIAGSGALADLAAHVKGSGKTLKVHVKVDTGMSRVGVRHGEPAADLIKKVADTEGLQLNGMYTHFAKADETDKQSALRQIDAFMNTIALVEQAGIKVPVKHMANSAAIIDLPQIYLDAVRPGIMLYGLYPSDEVHKDRVDLQPAMELKARVSHVKRVEAGTTISYGGTYAPKVISTIATIPVGYADGYSRILNGKGAEIIIRGHRYPVAGRICMDQFMVDAGNDEIAIGDEAVLFGRQGDAFVSADEVASKLGTINYEVTCMVSRRVPRVYREEQ
jgi:alanine racemase